MKTKLFWTSMTVLGSLALACGGAGSDGGASGASDITTGGGAPASNWLGTYANESSNQIFALTIKSTQPFTFDLVGARHVTHTHLSALGLTADTGGKDAASLDKVTFTKGDCTLKFVSSTDVLTLEQVGKCTSIGISDDTSFAGVTDGIIMGRTEDCYDASEESFRTKESCTAAPPAAAPAAPATPAPGSWVGLYGTESTRTIEALHIASDSPFTFDLFAADHLTHTHLAARGLTITPPNGTAATSLDTLTFTKGDCTLNFTKAATPGEDTLVTVEQIGACTSIGVSTDTDLQGFAGGLTLGSVGDECYDITEESFGTAGSCKDPAF